MEKHLYNIERASASWLHQKSINALEGINRNNDDNVSIKHQVDNEVKTFLRQ